MFGKDNPFSFSNSVGNTFSNAFKLFQLGAQILGEAKEEPDYSAFIKKHDFIPAQASRGVRYPQEMEPVIGLRGPSVQTALRYYAENPPSDVNFQSIQRQSYVAKPARYASTKPTMTLSDSNTITGRKKTIPVSGVMTV